MPSHGIIHSFSLFFVKDNCFLCTALAIHSGQASLASHWSRHAGIARLKVHSPNSLLMLCLCAHALQGRGCCPPTICFQTKAGNLKAPSLLKAEMTGSCECRHHCVGPGA